MAYKNLIKIAHFLVACLLFSCEKKLEKDASEPSRNLEIITKGIVKPEIQNGLYIVVSSLACQTCFEYLYSKIQLLPLRSRERVKIVVVESNLNPSFFDFIEKNEKQDIVVKDSLLKVFGPSTLVAVLVEGNVIDLIYADPNNLIALDRVLHHAL